MQLNFTKMQGCGNDFIVINTIAQPLELTTEQAIFLADRRFGVGCDQILLVGEHPDTDVDFSYRIINSDGTEVNACGNGARCFARFVTEQGLTQKTEIKVATAAGTLVLHYNPDQTVTVNMGTPRFSPADIPLDLPEQDNCYRLDQHQFMAVSIGNPHAVLVVDNTETANVATIGPHLETHAAFPENTNVGFMQIIDRGHIQLRVHERGVGETLACGTGACAAVVTGIQAGLLGKAVRVTLRGGRLDIKWQGGDEPVYMTGAAETVYQGTIKL